MAFSFGLRSSLVHRRPSARLEFPLEPIDKGTMRCYRHGGFTIIELMVGISVLSILLMVAVPSFMDIIRNNRITASANELVGALNYARSEAVRRGDPVSVCASADSLTCSAATSWGTGWIAFTDSGAAGTLNGTDAVLQIWPALSGGVQLNSVAAASPVSVARAFVQYTSTGMPSPIANTNFDLFKPGCVGNFARRIGVSTTGRISSATVSCP